MAAINRAMLRARGDVVVFSDANNLYDPGTLRELAGPFADPSVGAVTGAKSIAQGDGTLGTSEGRYWKYEAFIKAQETRLGCCVGVSGEVLALRRDLFQPAPDHIINDDFYMAMRAIRRGYRVVYAPKAISRERVSPSARDEMARRARIVAGRYQAIAHAHKLLPLRRPLVAWQIVSHKFLRPLVPLAMAGMLLTNLAAVVRPPAAGHPRLLVLGPPFAGALLILQAAFYAAAWLGHRAPDGSLPGRAFALPAYLVNSNLAAVIGLVRYLARSQSPLWERVPRRESPPCVAETDAPGPPPGDGSGLAREG
jgi:hypothetical protein